MSPFFYAWLSYISIPFLILRLWFKSLKQPVYRQRIAERLSFFTLPPTFPRKMSLWFHAVSLGEVIAAAPLIERLLKDYPAYSIVLTTTTPTGSQKAVSLFKDRVFHIYAPFDVPYITQRFLTIVQPKVAIIMETELWPNWFFTCKKNNIPVLIANARLSERSLKNYQMIPNLIKKTLECVEKLLVQAQPDAQRFIQLGMASDKIRVVGNVKFDLHVPPHIHETAQKFRALFGKYRLVWIAASTHEGEETIVLQAFHFIKKAHPNALLILVPRHPERFNRVAELAQKEEFTLVLRTELENTSPDKLLHMDILLGNTIGEMLLFYAASDVAFVGGSLIPLGGHNILEPAALYVPVISGTHMFNFQKIYDEFVQTESIITVGNTDGAVSLAEAVQAFFSDPHLREEYASLGFKIIERNQGAVEKHMEVVRNYL